MRTDVLFIQQFPLAYFGILSINAHLKDLNYTADILIESFEKDLIEKIRLINPRIIGFSVFSSEHLWLSSIAKKIKEEFPQIPLIAGGVHGLIYYQEILDDTDIDLVCCSDGERVLADVLVEFQKETRDWGKVSGIAYKTKSGDVIKSDAGITFNHRDDLVELRDIYFDRYPQLKRDEIAFFISSRGCLFSCSFCYNSYLRQLSSDKSQYIRHKSPDILIREICSVIEKQDVKAISFIDDMFTFNYQWLEEFLPRYKKEIGLPFACNTRADQIDQKKADMLADAGCRVISFGIETGSESLRRNILNKQISDDQIVEAGAFLEKSGIQARSSNMFCIPQETIDDARKTIELNIQAKIKSASSMLLLPYPKTRISQYCQSQGLFARPYTLHDIPHMTQKDSVLNLKDKKKIINVHYLSYWFVRYPWIFCRFFRVVYWERLNQFFYLFYLLSFFIRNKNESGIGWVAALRYAWQKRRLVLAKK